MKQQTRQPSPLQYVWIALALIASMLLNACSMLATTPPSSPVPGLAQTLAAQTMTADPKLLALVVSPTPHPTDTPVPTVTATFTPSGPPTYTPLPTVPTEMFSELALQEALTITLTATPYPTPDYTQKLADGSPAPCNAAQFVEDVTVPDEMRISVGNSFTKVWRIKNVGACTWTPEYTMILVWGQPMGAKPPISFPQVVKPGETVDLAIKLTAPYIPACWQSNWKLVDPELVEFGVGYKFVQALYVTISVYVPGIRFMRDPCKNK